MDKVFKFSLIILIPVFLLSCATAVRFRVEHPPLVDLHNVNSITVIPFEKNSSIGYSYLSSCVTSALIHGMKNGTINFVDPQVLENVQEKDYAQYVDLYVSGRITNVVSDDTTETREENNKGSMIRIIVSDRTVTIDIEYSYIRAANHEVIGVFKKSETSSNTFRRFTERNVRRPWRSRGLFFRRGSWSERVAESAISKFSGTMVQELGPWETKEKRNIKGSTGRDPDLKAAKMFVRQNNYNEALGIYNNLYEQTGSVTAGYNTAILLQANEDFPKALGLLLTLDNAVSASGEKTPSYVKKEIEKVKNIITGLKILESYR